MHSIDTILNSRDILHRLKNLTRKNYEEFGYSHVCFIGNKPDIKWICAFEPASGQSGYSNVNTKRMSLKI